MARACHRVRVRRARPRCSPLGRLGFFVVAFLVTVNAVSYRASEEHVDDREGIAIARERPCAVVEARSSLASARAVDVVEAPSSPASARAVDVVYTWVNGSDPAFRDALARRKAQWRGRGGGERGRRPRGGRRGGTPVRRPRRAALLAPLGVDARAVDQERGRRDEWPDPELVEPDAP